AIAVGLALAAVAVLRTVAVQPDDEVHPALWFVGAGVASGPALLLVGTAPRLAGVNDAVLVAFTGNGLALLWLGSVAIGAALYVLPTESGVPLYSRSLAALGFWGWVVLAPLAAGAKLLSGPAPDWWETLGTAASIALLIPVLAIVTVLALTYARRVPSGTHSAALRFALAGTVFFGLYGGLRAVGALRTVASVLHLTVAIDAGTELALYGVIGSWLAAGVYAALPALTGNTALSPAAQRRHVWLVVSGVALVVVPLLVGGIVQGALWQAGVRDGSGVFLGSGWSLVSDAVRPWLWARAAGEAVLFLAWGTLFQQVLSTYSYGQPLATAPAVAVDVSSSSVVVRA
ncbi:MAG: cbb3-type cytochrome c oxidase subunit I, partial [Mycobacteriales bacterium]